MKMDSKQLVPMLCAVLVALALLAGLLYGLYRLVLGLMAPGVVAVWALLVTALLPAASRVCYRLGQLEAKGQIAGLHTGLMAAISAGKDIGNVKVNIVRELRQPDVVQPINLPIVDVRPRQLPSGDNAKIYM